MTFFKNFRIRRLKKKIDKVDNDIYWIDQILTSTFSPQKELRKKRTELRWKKTYLQCDLLNLRRS